ncbi:MAG: MogA/MoaB family molybdenum cofactor biosynthesis protein [Bryobacteraceae bacterium]
MIAVAVITISDAASAGTRSDASGPALRDRAAELGWEIRTSRVIPDERETISRTLMELCQSGVDVILTTGGTGIAPRDVTPEAVCAIADREIPGFGELMRGEGRKSTKFAPLSRGGASVRGDVLIVTLPGSPRGAVDSLNAVAELIPHAVDLLHGRTAHSQHGSKPAS